MSYLPNRAPQVKKTDLWKWVRPDEVPVDSYNDYPQNPSDGDFFKNTDLTPNQYFQYKAGTGWEPVSPTGSFQVPLIPTGQSPVQFHDTEHSGSEASLFLVYINEDDPQVDGPLLMTDRGLIVKKDLMAGGFLNSGQGTLWLNYGLVGKPKLASPPAIQLMSSATPYPSGTQFPDISPDWYEEGQLFNLTSSYYWSCKSKTYPAGKYRWEGSGQNGDWVKDDSYTGNYDTLYLCKDNLIAPAHLDLGNLTAHGSVKIGDGTIYWQTATTPDVLEMNCGLIIDGALNANGISTSLLGTSGDITLNPSSVSWTGQVRFKFGATNYFFMGLAADATYGQAVGDFFIYDSRVDKMRANINSSGDLEVVGGSLKICGGTTDRPGLWFKSWGTVNSYGGSVGIGLDTGSKMILNSAAGGVHFANLGTTVAYIDGYGNLETGGNMKTSGAIHVNAGNYLWLSTDAYLVRNASRVIACYDENGSLATLEASNIKADHWMSASGGDCYFFNHLRAAGSGLNIMPYTNNYGNIGGNGSGTNYYWGAVYANYLMYHTNHTSFDHLDDLDAVKSYKIKQENGTSIIDPDSLPFLKDEEGFYRPDIVNGFLLGCAKTIATKQDENEARFEAMLQEIENLQSKVQQLKQEIEN